MQALTESFAWCMLQVTILAIVSALLYFFVRRVSSNCNSALLVVSLTIIGVLTFLTVSPWPRWETPQWKWHTVPVPRENVVKLPRQDDWPPIRRLKLSEFDTDSLVTKSLNLADVESQDIESSKSETLAQRARQLCVYTAWAIIAVGLGRAIVGLIFLRRVCRNSKAVEDPAVLKLFHDLGSQVGIRPRVLLRESRQLNGAATVGWQRPLVMLPHTWSAWSLEELRVVLAHELAHIRLRHFPSYLVSHVAVVAHYYHPLVHWLGRRLRLEQETDADQLAARVFGQRQQYALILARLALRPAQSEQASAGIGLFMSRPLLMRRIAMLRRPANSTPKIARYHRGVAVTLIVLSALGVAGLRKKPAAVAQQASPKDIELAVPAADGLQSAADLIVGAPSATAAARAPAIDVGQSVATVTAILQFSGWPDRIIGQDEAAGGSATWKVIGNTQATLIRSNLVLQSALAAPEIAKLAIVKAQKSPIAWLQNQLSVGLYPDTNLLYVSMQTASTEAAQAAKLVDEIVDAYMNEVVNKGKQRRSLMRDALARSFENVNKELSRKMQDYYDIAKEVGSAEAGGGQLMQQIALRRLDRVETELMRLEDELEKLRSGGEPEAQKLATYYEKRMSGLRKQQEELLESLRASSDKSVDMTTRKSELEQLETIAAELSRNLEMMDVSLSTPEGAIQVIQRAAASVPSEEAGDAHNEPLPENMP
jgi:beta-lactamase regulating signal transducer with metallopeptidase domain